MCEEILLSSGLVDEAYELYGLLALHWLVQGYGYEITSDDVWMAFEATMNAAEKLGAVAETRGRVRTMITASALGGDFVKKILGRKLDLL